MFVCSPDAMASGANQQTQSLTKPAFTEAQASALVESVFGLKVSKIQPLPSYDDQNFHVYISRTNNTADGPAEYVLKICNTETSKNPDLIEVQNCIIMFLKAAGFPTACVCRTKEGNTTSLVSIGERRQFSHIPALGLPVEMQCWAQAYHSKWSLVISPAFGKSHRSPTWRLGLWFGSGCSQHRGWLFHLEII